MDETVAGKGVLYLSRVKAKAVQSRLNRIASLPIYKLMTIRNWKNDDEATRTARRTSDRLVNARKRWQRQLEEGAWPGRPTRA